MSSVALTSRFILEASARPNLADIAKLLILRPDESATNTARQEAWRSGPPKGVPGRRTGGTVSKGVMELAYLRVYPAGPVPHGTGAG